LPRIPFLITIDTEGDNLWSRPREITTRNSKFLARFQQLCERCGFKPTWLTNYEMAVCPVFQEFARDVIKRETAEIGMHLHAWNSPPIQPLTNDDLRHQPYLIDYPHPLIRDKIRCLTELLSDTFQCPLHSHRAGRWAMDRRYARELIEAGYSVDCSVTPHVSWTHMQGAPTGNGGSDYRTAPNEPYWLSDDDISKAGHTALLEIPMTIRPVRRSHLSSVALTIADRFPSRHIRQVRRALFPEVQWFRPHGRNRRQMIRILDDAVDQPRSHLEFMLHSSELMPGGSPRFPTERSIERLYDDLEALFEAAQGRVVGATLAEFYNAWTATRQPAAGLGPAICSKSDCVSRKEAKVSTSE